MITLSLLVALGLIAWRVVRSWTLATPLWYFVSDGAIMALCVYAVVFTLVRINE